MPWHPHSFARTACDAAHPRAPSAASSRRQRPPAQPPRPTRSHAPTASELGCEHFRHCSGCAVEDDLARPPVLHIAAAFFDGLGHPGFQLHAGSPHHWRHRARLAVRRDAAGGLAVGLFRLSSHDAVDIPSCRVHHPALNAAANLIRGCISSAGVEPYDERSGEGQLRYLQLSVVQRQGGGGGSRAAAERADAVQAVLVWNAARSAPRPGLADFARRLWEADQRRRAPLLHSIVANFQPERTNAILGPAFEVLHGPGAAAWARLGQADVCHDPGSFMQANPGAMDEALAVMRQFVAPGASVVDLHAGVGTIGLSLAATRQLASLRLVEINPSAELPFRRSWSRLAAEVPSAAATPAEYHVAAAGSDPARWLDGADVAVVDPPRKGLDPELLSFLCRRGPAGRLRRLIYLSCGWPAFRRDCVALLASDGWRLAAAHGFLFFPGTDHIETLAVFDRVDGLE